MKYHYQNRGDDMGFRVKHGSADTIAKLGALAGEAKFDQKRQAVALEMATRIQQQQQRVELAEFNVQAQQDAMKFQQQWEYEKIKIAQQNDFQMAEQLRMRKIEDQFMQDQRRKAEFDAVNKAIQESEILSDFEKEQKYFETAMKFNQGPYSDTSKSGEDSILSALRSHVAPQPTSETVILRNKKTGLVGPVPLAQVEEALQTGDYERQ